MSIKKPIEIFDDLLIDHLSSNLSSNDAKLLLEFLNSDDLYKCRYDELIKAHAKSHIPRFEKEKASNYDQLLKTLYINQQPVKKVSPWRYIRRIAATMALIITSSIAIYYLYDDISILDNSSQTVAMEVPLGSQMKVVLPDGSAVHLNSGSTLKYDISYVNKKRREVELIGEGYFEVEKNASKPFIVKTKGLNVKVLGTKFNVKAYLEDANIEVNLLEGKVSVFPTSGSDGIIMSPNDHLVYNKSTQKVWNSKINSNLSAKWVKGELRFVNSSLTEIMKELERKYNVQVVIQTSKMKDEYFSGSAQVTYTLDEILDFIDVDKKYKWIRNKNVITIMDK